METTITTGELTTESNLPKGRQIFIKDKNNNDLAVLFNWETDTDKFLEREKELQKLAKLYTSANLLKQALEGVLNNLNGHGDVHLSHVGKVLAEIRSALKASE